MTFLDCTCVPEKDESVDEALLTRSARLNLGQGECPVHQKELREMSASQPEKGCDCYRSRCACTCHGENPIVHEPPVVEQAALDEAERRFNKVNKAAIAFSAEVEEFADKLAAETQRADKAEARVKELERWEPVWRAPKAKP